MTDRTNADRRNHRELLDVPELTVAAEDYKNVQNIII